MNVFEVFDPDEENRPAATPEPPRRTLSPRRVLAVVLVLVVLGAAAGAVLIIGGHRKGSTTANTTCTPAQLATRDDVQSWLQQILDTSLGGRQRGVDPLGCAPGTTTTRIGGITGVVDDEELTHVRTVLAQTADCTIGAVTAQTPATCQTTADGRPVTVMVRDTAANSPRGDYELLAFTSPQAASSSA